jgi:hypothetical protein
MTNVSVELDRTARRSIIINKNNTAKNSIDLSRRLLKDKERSKKNPSKSDILGEFASFPFCCQTISKMRHHVCESYFDGARHAQFLFSRFE